MLITFEGIEGSGKSTQVELLNDYLLSKGHTVVRTREPGGSLFGEALRKVLLQRDMNIFPLSELLVFMAMRAQHVEQVILPALQERKIVLCDRFVDATYAYQGAARGLNLEFIKAINDYSSMGLKPNLTLLFDLPVEIGLQRATERDNRLKDSSFSDRFERESLNFHNKVRAGYLNILKSEPERFRLIDAARDVDTIQKEVQRHITEFIGQLD